MMNACGFCVRDRNFFGLKCSGSTKIEFLLVIPAQLRAPEYRDGSSAEAGLGGGQESIDSIKGLGAQNPVCLPDSCEDILRDL